MTFFVPLTALFLGLGAVSDEIETKNITFTLTRPLSRFTIAVGRVLGHLVAALAILMISLFCAYLSNMLFQVEDMFAMLPQLINHMFVLGFGLSAYLAVVSLLGSVLKKFAIVVSIIWLFFDFGYSLVSYGLLKFVNIRYYMLASLWESLPEFMMRALPVEKSPAFGNFLVCMLFVAASCALIGVRLNREIVLTDAGK